MNRIPPLVRVPLRYGLIGGAVGSLAIAVLYALGKHPFLLPIIVDFRIILFAVFIFFSLRELRDQWLSGLLFFWQGMVASYVFIVSCGLVGGIFTWGLARWNDAFIPSYIEKLQAQMLTYKSEIVQSVGAEAYQQQLAKLPGTTALDLAGDYFLKSLIIGLFLAIVISVILRKTPPNPN